MLMIVAIDAPGRWTVVSEVSEETCSSFRCTPPYYEPGFRLLPLHMK